MPLTREKYDPNTGGVQIIGRNSRFMGYFVTKTKKSAEKKCQKIQG